MCLIEGSEHIISEVIFMKCFPVIARHTRIQPIKFERSKFIDDVTKNRQNLKKRHSFTWSELSKNHISFISQSISLQFDVTIKGPNIFHCMMFRRDESRNVTSRILKKLY